MTVPQRRASRSRERMAEVVPVRDRGARDRLRGLPCGGVGYGLQTGGDASAAAVRVTRRNGRTAPRRTSLDTRAAYATREGNVALADRIRPGRGHASSRARPPRMRPGPHRPDGPDAGADEADGGEEETADDGTAAHTRRRPSRPTPAPARARWSPSKVTGRACIDRWEARSSRSTRTATRSPSRTGSRRRSQRPCREHARCPAGLHQRGPGRDACAASHKRLCLENEWMTCTGPEKTTFPYGDARRRTPAMTAARARSARSSSSGARELDAGGGHLAKTAAGDESAARRERRQARASHVEEGGGRPRNRPRKPTLPPKAWLPAAARRAKGQAACAAKASKKPANVDDNVWHKLNDPRLGQVDGALAKTGSHGDCTNGFGVLDMMGNIHRVSARRPARRTALSAAATTDTSINGDGCSTAHAHAHDYHDYSTGRRCATRNNWL